MIESHLEKCLNDKKSRMDAIRPFIVGIMSRLRQELAMKQGRN